MDDADLKRVAEAATPGPWADPWHAARGPSWGINTADPHNLRHIASVPTEQEEDALFIATFDPPTVLSLLARLSAAEAEIARRDAVAQASWGDQKDEHTEAIRAAHPTRTDDFETYDTALAMIGTRHGKYELVNLVNWLLARAKAAEAQASPHELAELRGDRKTLIDAGFQNAEAVLARVGVLEEALRVQRGYVWMWTGDVDCGVSPTIASLQGAKYSIDAALTQEPTP
jgi:hypothetical protein